ncbi:MAG: oligosaccharide flippase family protein [Myxococcales bacterium]|nr:oligosaccharide flippase family protein [Myxococcales bacterium]
MAEQTALRRLLKHASILLGGNAAGAGFAFLTGVAAARYLGPEGLGRLALVQSFVLGIDKLMNFQSWRTVIKFGADATEADAEFGGSERLREVLLFGTVLDLLSASAGALVAVVGAFFAAKRLGWDSQILTAAIIYGALILTNVRGTPIGVLRMYDRFGAFVWQRLLAGPVKLVGVLLAWWLDLGPVAILAAWMISDQVSNLAIIVPAWRELKKRDLLGFWRADLRGIGQRHPGIVHFSLVSNLSTAIRAASRELDNFAVALLLSESALGLYKVAKQYAQVLGVASDPLAQANYPDLARHAARGERDAFIANLWAGLRVGALVAVPYLLFLWLFGDWLIGFTVGEQFAGAVPVMLWYTASLGIGVLGFSLPGATMSLGKPNVNLASVGAATAVYFACLVPSVRLFGLVGAGLAYMVFYVVWSAVIVRSVVAAIRVWQPGGPVAGDAAARVAATGGGSE